VPADADDRAGGELVPVGDEVGVRSGPSPGRGRPPGAARSPARPARACRRVGEPFVPRVPLRVLRRLSSRHRGRSWQGTKIPGTPGTPVAGLRAGKIALTPVRARGRGCGHADEAKAPRVRHRRRPKDHGQRGSPLTLPADGREQALAGSGSRRPAADPGGSRSARSRAGRRGYLRRRGPRAAGWPRGQAKHRSQPPGPR
jgi:hypothetical protein